MTSPAPSPAGVTRGGGGGEQQACAACKYQRRRCAKDCILAPFFPPERQRQFVNAHRLFGVSNIVKIIRHLDPPRRREAMASICFQADARALDPAGGCFRIVLDLEDQIRRESAELDALLAKLSRCRAALLPVLPPSANPFIRTTDDKQAGNINGAGEHGSSSSAGGKSAASSSSPAPAMNFYSDYDDEVKPHLLGMFECKPPLLSNTTDLSSSSFPCRLRTLAFL